MIVLSWSKVTRDLLKSFSWGIVALRQLFASDDGAISSPPAPYHLFAGGSRIRTSGSGRKRATVQFKRLNSEGGARRFVSGGSSCHRCQHACRRMHRDRE